MTPDLRTENQNPDNIFKTEVQKKKKKSVKAKKSATAVKPVTMRPKHMGDKMLAKTDLVLIHKQVDHVAKRALVEIKLGVEPEEEDEMVMEWCQTSALRMMQVMSLKQAKNFTRKITDFLQERKNEDLGIAKANLHTSRADTFLQSLDISEVTNAIDSTLEKIRNKIIDKAMEAESILKDYEKTLIEGSNNFEDLKKQLSQFDEKELEQL